MYIYVYHTISSFKNLLIYIIGFLLFTGRANIVLVPVLDHEIVGKKIVAIVTEIETEIEIVTETEIVIAIATVIVDVDRDQEIEETAIETGIIATEIGIDEIETETETEEGNDLLHQSLFPEQDYHLERASVPLACKSAYSSFG